MRTALTVLMLAATIACASTLFAQTEGSISIKAKGTRIEVDQNGVSGGPPNTYGVFVEGASARLVPYFDEALTQRAMCAVASDTVTIYIVAERIEKPITRIEYSVTIGSPLTYIDEQNEFSGVSGTAPSGVTIDFDSPVDASGQVLLQRIRCATNAGCTAACTGATTQKIVVAKHPVSTLLQALDVNGRAVSIIGEGSLLCDVGIPDLEISSFSAPANAMVYDNIASQVSVTVYNAGTHQTHTSYWVYYYLSSDPTITTTDLRIATKSVTLVLAAGASYTVPSPTILIPVTVTPGDYYIGAWVDAGGGIVELDDGDNTDSRPVTVSSNPSRTPVCVYAEDFQEGSGIWEAQDLTDTPLHWNWTDGGWWCGADDVCWTTTPGYGNYWNEWILSEGFVVPSAPVALTYSIQYDTEPDFDFVYVEITTDGESYAGLRSYTGNSAGFVTGNVDLSAYVGMWVRIRFRVVSDGTGSDEDGNYDSNGACRLDWVQVTGLPPEDFETGPGTWHPAKPAPMGGEFRLVYDPICYVPVPCEINAFTKVPQVGCNAWVAYDPASEQFPSTSAEQRASDGAVRVAITSQMIPIPDDATGYILEFDVYDALPLGARVFRSWEVQAIPEGGCPGEWQNDGVLSYGTGGWSTVQRDITAYIPDGSTSIRVRLVAEEYFAFGEQTEPHTPAPYFDNVKIWALGTAQPGIDVTGFPRSCSTADSDLDGVGNLVDACPAVSSVPFDRDGDGCADQSISARHIEFLRNDTMSYYIHEDGVPAIVDGSDFTEIAAGVSAWGSIAGVDMAVEYKGMTTQRDARATDGMNLVTFSDPDYVFPTGVLGVGITTSFTEQTYFSGRPRRPGEIIDCDIMFNPVMQFRTPSAGSGTDVRSVTTHEAGHLFGLSHSAVKGSTMYYVLPPDTQAASLELEDRLAILRAYPEDGVLPAVSRLQGRVLDGISGGSVCGAIVFAVDAMSGDTLGCDYSLRDGSFSFIGLPDGDYYVSIYPLNGSSVIGYLQPRNINEMIDEYAATLFVPEYYDVVESATDDPLAKTAVSVAAASTQTITIITNRDDVGPQVVEHSPASDETDVHIDASVLVSFSEPIDIGTLSGNFSLTDTMTHTFVRGNAALIEDDSTLAFIPSDNLTFETVYRLELKTGIHDKYGNGLVSPLVVHFMSEPKPDVGIESIAPRKSVVGATAVISGYGFEEDPAQNLVDFSGTPALVTDASSTRLVVVIPDGATTGSVTVSNLVEGKTSNPLTFTVLAGEEVARGYEAGVATIGGVARSLAVLPDGSLAFAATDAGYTVVVVDPGAPDYLESMTFPVAGGLRELCATPEGKRVYAVGGQNNMLYRINAERGAGGLTDLTVLNEVTLGAEPRGVIVEPSGRRAYVTTADNIVEVWDVNTRSATFEERIGELASLGSDLGGKMATDPAGELLFLLVGSGTLNIYDLPGDSLRGTVSVGLEPRDVVVDATGERAYVAGGDGSVTVVSIGALAKIMEIPIGGTLRSVALTPAGSFLYAVNRELNLYDVIDLRRDSEMCWGVAANIPLRVNPVDAEMCPDGNYICSLSEKEWKLVVTAIGVGPVVSSVAPVSAPVGGVVVIAGSDFTKDESLTVTFNGVAATVASRTDSVLVVAVPPGSTSGPLVVTGSNPFKPDAPSNEVYFEVLGGTTENTLRLAAKIGVGGGDLGNAVALSPNGKMSLFAIRGAGLDTLLAVDTDPSSASFHQIVGTWAVGPDGAIDAAAVSPDGERALIIDDRAGSPGESSFIRVVNVNPRSDAFMTVTDSIDVAGITEGLGGALFAPHGWSCLLSEYANAGSSSPSQVHLVDLDPSSEHACEIVGSVSVASGDVAAMAFDPSGGYCYIAVSDPDNAAIAVLDMDAGSASFMTIVATLPLPGTPPQPVPRSLAFTPDGRRCLVLTEATDGSGSRAVIMVNSTNPASPATSHSQDFGSGVSGENHITVSPRGDRAILAYEAAGLANLAVSVDPDGLTMVSQAALGGTVGEIGYIADASRLYTGVPAEDSVFVYDFSAAEAITKVSGDGQSGIAGQVLQAALRVRVTGAGTTGASGVPVIFRVSSGGGFFAGSGSSKQVCVSDDAGYVSVTWALGPEIGAQAVEATAPGLAGSPLAFSASAAVDPATLPLEAVDVIPIDSTTNVNTTTAVQVIFSRAVDRATVDSTVFFMHERGSTEQVSTVIGFTDGDRKLSLTPRTPLLASTAYLVEVTSGLHDMSGNALQNPQAYVFTTALPPPLVLEAVSPACGRCGVHVVLSGSGFARTVADNTVLFGGIEAAVTDGGTDYLDVVVPYEASGNTTVQVVAGGHGSNFLNFSVILPEAGAIDKRVLAKVGTGSATRSVAVTPDGTRLYAVSPSANIVVAIDIDSRRPIGSIPVGENPYAIAVDSRGSRIYVTNFLGNSVSVVDILPGSPTNNSVLATVSVGVNPVDALATPDGDRLIVANLGSDDLSIIDTDESSDTYSRVLATVGTGSTPRSIAVTPDGGKLYVGTKDGYLVIDVLDCSVVANVGTGNSTKSIAVTPDGAFLVLLTTSGQVLIFDVAPGSPSENQVVGQITTGGNTKSVAVTPDGGLLYLIQEALDRIYAVRLSVTNSTGVIGSPADAALMSVEGTIIDTLRTGEDPEDIAFAANGSGIAVITNAGDNSVTIHNPELGPIAVMLSGFSAAQTDEGAELIWSTASERNIAGFYLMRSSAEGVGYERIMTEPVKAKGYAGSYRYIDHTIAPNEQCYYELEAVDEKGGRQVFGPIEFTYVVQFGLAQNVPNPFNPLTSIRFSIPRPAVVSLVIYDVSGREIRRLVAGRMPSGRHEVKWDGRNGRGAAVSSGMYFCRLKADKDMATRKLMLLR